MKFERFQVLLEKTALDRLRARRKATGVPIGAQIRRAIRLYIDAIDIKATAIVGTAHRESRHDTAAIPVKAKG